MKGFSILSRIPFFDIIQNCSIESFHCLWEGIVKQFCNLWFDSQCHKEKWYIGKPNLIGKFIIFFYFEHVFSNNG